MKKLLKNFIQGITGKSYYRYLYLKFSFVLNQRQFLNDKKDRKLRREFYSAFIKKGDLVFDIGANEGNKVRPLLDLGATIVAVEPQKECCKLLKHKFDNRIDIIQKGVGSKVEIRKLHISEYSVLSTFSEEWVNNIVPARFESPYINEELVEMTTLDELQKKYGTPVFIKIDVEGFELEVLKGLTNMVDMISVEYMPELPDDLVKCLQRVYEIDKNILINYSVGESMEWAMHQWVSYIDFLGHIQKQEFIRGGFGDIYIKRTKLLN